jgi:murein tripeptide amidase MpaA
MLSRSLMRALVALTALAIFAIAVPPASAGELLSTMVSTDSAKFRRCHAELAQGASGVTTRRVTVSDAGLVWARLSGSDAADWDLAVFDSESGRVVAGSAGPRSNELAEGFSLGGRELTVQACRLSGDSTSPTVTVSSFAQELSTTAEAIQLVRVDTATQQDKRRLSNLGLDLTEHAGPGFVEVVLYGSQDANTLQGAGFTWTVVIPDMVARTRANRQADAEFAAATERSALPSGRDSYRRLADYEWDLKQLVGENPGLVKLITLNHKSLEGRDVLGVQITPNVGMTDGKPVFLQMGVHHAREWPSSEHAIEWGFEVVNAYRAVHLGGTPTAFQTQLAALSERVRTVVVPVVNPDGFNLSREAPVDLRVLGDAHPLGHLAAILGDPGFAYKRRNCRVQDGAAPTAGECARRTNRNRGVDPNRNYGGLWGGPGASLSPTNDTYRGPGPFSEPETQNIRELVSSMQVTALITNHTYSNLVLRPPGVAAQGPPPDEEIYKALGDAMAEQNGYLSQKGYQLYDTTGTTEDWTYPATGGLGFTFEIGPEEFHPPFEDVVGEYTGSGGFEGKGNRAAYLLAMQAAGDTSKHALIEGNAKPGNVIRLKKTFLTSSHDPLFLDDDGETTGPPIVFRDNLDTSLVVPASGKFSFHANPSTRPAVAERTFVKLADEPFKTESYHNTMPTVPGGGATDPVNIVERPFTVSEADAAEGVIVHLLGADGDDYDLYVYRVLEDGTRVPVASAADGDSDEKAIVEKPIPGNYIYRVVNWLAFQPEWHVTIGWYKAGETVFEAGTVESWTLTCESATGTVLAEHKVIIDRGERKLIGGVCTRKTK